MPIYAYRCTSEKCENTIEMIRKFSESNDELICSECGELMEKFIDSAAVVELKGGDSNDWSPRTHSQLSKRRRYGK